MRAMVNRYLCRLALSTGLIGAILLPCVARAAALFDVRMTANPTRTEIVLGVGQASAFHIGSDGNRVTADFPSINLIPGAAVSHGVGLVRTYHAEPLPDGGVRLVLDLARPAIVSSSRSMPANGGMPASVVIDLTPGSTPAVIAESGPGPAPAVGFLRPPDAAPAVASTPHALSHGDPIAALLSQPEPPVPVQGAKRVKPAVAEVEPPAPQPEPEIVPAAVVEPAPHGSAKYATPNFGGKKKVIVIDAGHGGIDPGAESVAGFHEKEVTLATALALRRALEQTGRYTVVMTRDTDVYLKLHERVARARAAHGNLFISLHADSAAGASSTRGASIYTLSETASDVESEKYAQRENRADAIGGVDLGDQRDDVAGILVDLTVRETVNDGNRLAGMMVDALENGGVGLLPTTPHRSAGFAVLKSPDIPSILIEMGYLSDMADSRALMDPRHQQQVARAIADGVDHYFSWAQRARS